MSIRNTTTSILALAAAASAATTAIAEKPPTPDFELIRYRLPETHVTARLSLTLEKCDATGITVSGESSLAAEAGATSQSFGLTSRQLESARVKRAVDIALHDTGVIATIDSAVEDRTGAIIGDAVRFVASVAGAFTGFNVGSAANLKQLLPQDQVKALLHRLPTSPPAPSPTWCADRVADALARVSAIDFALRQRGAFSADIKEAAEQSAAVDRLAAERAALRAGVLHVDLKTELDLAASSAGDSGSRSTSFDLGPLERAWLKKPDPNNPPRPLALAASWTVTAPNATGVSAPDAPSSRCRSSLDAINGAGICFTTPAFASFKADFVSTGIKLGEHAGLPPAKGGFPVPQWGTLQVLGLSAGFGAKRETSLTLDKFGRVSSAKWTSAARAENGMATLAGVAGQVNGIVAANSQTARRKEEIEELTTQQTLNRLRACREILAAGGSACPAEAAVGDAR